MKKSYKIDVDCANCANKMEDAAKRTPGSERRSSKLHAFEDECGV